MTAVLRQKLVAPSLLACQSRSADDLKEGYTQQLHMAYHPRHHRFKHCSSLFCKQMHFINQHELHCAYQSNVVAPSSSDTIPFFWGCNAGHWCQCMFKRASYVQSAYIRSEASSCSCSVCSPSTVVSPVSCSDRIPCGAKRVFLNNQPSHM